MNTRPVPLPAPPPPPPRPPLVDYAGVVVQAARQREVEGDPVERAHRLEVLEEQREVGERRRRLGVRSQRVALRGERREELARRALERDELAHAVRDGGRQALVADHLAANLRPGLLVELVHGGADRAELVGRHAFLFVEGGTRHRLRVWEVVVGG